ncbi:hypothetical protein [Enterococcus pallens]|uniref:PRD domain-containing protein n=1 Tax=Enterococcus pallens ATCC BAA-351 TaxID=1158607 RepID=R2QFA0_9ENTE|nr:hypothetical protein [Enterococcus pallens]EOH93898.1 hypothetical protein UAU_02594 [Enterococcus pallens ATCC BAA-351]EOU24738.1 hypothetical protein I588_00725 [Enterococcus pallens ATCC BAA-351]OJG77658.1 hypothetical protein RV10_GL002334 [Enterococcus pallens]
MTNKQKILQLLEKECQRYIDLTAFTFANCHASYLANELFLDRSNVSRILNDLHREKQLIKLKGKPAYYFSRKVLEAAFPFATFPEAFSSREEMQTLLQFSSTSRENTLLKNFHLIGSEKGGSLHPLVHQILPLFYLPKQTLQVIVLQGNFGTGKKLFLRRLIDLGRLLHYFPENPEVFYVDGQLLQEHLFDYLEKFHQQKNQILVVATNDAPQKSLALINNLHYHYLNQQEELLLVILANEQVDTAAWKDITPFVLQFTDIRNRSTKEVLQIAQVILLNEAQRLKRTLRIPKTVLQVILAQAQNLHQLELLLQHAVANSLMSVRNHEGAFLYLEQPAFTSSQLPHLEEVPEIMTIRPEDTMDSLADCFVAKKEDQQTHSALLAYLLFQYSQRTDQHAYLTKEFLTEKLLSSVHTILTRSLFSQDPILVDNLQELILQIFMREITEPADKAAENYPDSRLLPLQNKLEQQARLLPYSLTTVQQALLRQTLADAYQLVASIDIPIVVVSQYHLLAQLYVNTFNQAEHNRRCFYFPVSQSRPTENSAKKNHRLYQFAYEINRGQGVLLLTDQTSYKAVMEHFFLKTKVITYCLTLDSFALLDDCIHALKSSSSSLIPLIPNLLELAKTTEQEIQESDLTKRDRVTKLFTKMSTLFPQVDVYETNDALYRWLLEVNKELNLEITPSFILEFRFVGNALFQSKKNKQPLFILTDEEKNTLQSLMLALEKAASYLPKTLPAFSTDELAPFAQCLQKHQDFQKLR